MNAFRYETASLIAADPRLASLLTQFTTGSARFRPSTLAYPPCYGRYTSISPDPRN
jgi:hypothetical protein